MKLVETIRAAVGDDVELAIDAGLAWDAKTAIRRAKLLEPYRLMWLEEPLHPDDLRGYRRLSEAEEECTREGFRRLMDEGRVDVVQIDVTRVGLTQAMLIAADAEQRSLPVANHTFTTDLNAAASLHFLAAIPECADLRVLRRAERAEPPPRRPIRSPPASA